MSEVEHVFCDGGLIGPTNPSQIGGTWAWVRVSVAGERICHDSGVYIARSGLVTNNVAEYLAACKALAALPGGWSGTLASDSQITIGRLFWGWANNGIPQAWVERTEQLFARLGRVGPLLLQGHPTKAELLAGVGSKGFRVSGHNVWCDEECGRRAREYLSKQRRIA